MGYRKYTLSGGLTTEDLNNILSEVLAVLDTVGVEIKHPEILDFLAGKEGVKVRDSRAFYSNDLVLDFIEQAKSQNAEYSYNRKGSDRFRMVGPYLGLYYADPDTGERKLPSSEEFIDAIKLCDSLDMYGCSPLHLQTAPVHMRQIATERFCLENSREIGGYCPAMNIKEAEFMCRLGQASGRKPPYCTLEIPISPLRINHDALDIVYRNLDRSHNLTGLCLGGGVVPMPGATAPIFYPGNLVQAMADALAAYITPKLIDPDVYGYCSFGGFLFDLRKMEPHSPFPESVTYWLAVRQVINHVLGETMGAEFVLDTQNPQDVFQTAFAISLGVCAGATAFLGVGADKIGSSGDCGFDPVAAVIHADIIRHCERFAKGLPFREEKGISLKTIREGVFESAMNSYLDHPTTLDYRELYLEPALFFKYSGEELREQARAIVKKRIAEHSFSLPQDRVDEIAEICGEADAVLKEDISSLPHLSAIGD